MCIGGVVRLSDVCSQGNDDCSASTRTSCLRQSLTLNLVYYVQVGGFGGATGYLGLVVAAGAPPNDNFAR